MSAVCGARYASKELEMADDGVFVWYPHRVGRGILLVGKKASKFPFQLFIGPDWPCMTITYSLIIVPTVLFINNIAAYWNPAVTLFAVLLLFNSPPEEPNDNLELGQAPETVRRIECTFCKVQRPITASHCYECAVCVEELDHHCPWTGKCIGKKNLKTFYFFLHSLALLVTYVLVFVVVTGAQGNNLFSFSPKS